MGPELEGLPANDSRLADPVFAGGGGSSPAVAADEASPERARSKSDAGTTSSRLAWVAGFGVLAVLTLAGTGGGRLVGTGAVTSATESGTRMGLRRGVPTGGADGARRSRPEVAGVTMAVWCGIICRSIRWCSGDGCAAPLRVSVADGPLRWSVTDASLIRRIDVVVVTAVSGTTLAGSESAPAGVAGRDGVRLAAAVEFVGGVRTDDRAGTTPPWTV